jgi:general secretion pathway protein K
MTDPRHPRERGIALLLVLWVFMILGVLALDFARYIRDDAMAAVNFADETRGYYLALAGMNRAIFDAERARERAPGKAAPASTGAARPGRGAKTPVADDEDQEEGVPPDGEWHEDAFAGGRYAVRMTDESGRISLNKADEALLTLVVTNIMQLMQQQGSRLSRGFDKRAAENVSVIVDSILDWRDPDDLKRLHGAESDYYMGQRTPYRAKNGFFDSPEELMLVRGVSAALFYGSEGIPGLRDLFSAYNRSGNVNVRTASAAVFQIVLGVDAAAAADLVSQRGDDASGFLPQIQAQVSTLDPHLATLLVNEAPHIVTIEARADLADPRNQSRVAAVVDISWDASEGAKVIRWLDRAPFEGGLPAGESASGGAS